MATPTSNATSAASNGSRLRALTIITLIFASLGGGYYFYQHGYGQYHEQTDDAYVGGNQIYVNSQIPGTVISVDAEDNQQVQAGISLVKLDATDSTVSLADAAANLAQTVRNIRQQYSSVDAAAAVVKQRQTELERAQHDLARRTPLANSDVLASEDIEHARDAVSTAAAGLHVAEAQLAQAHTLVDGSPLRTQPSLLHARAAYVQASLAQQRTVITAPVAGTVAKRNVQVGQRITPENPLLALVPLDQLWVDANFKESQLAHIRIGQPAVVETDVYGSRVEYHGKVVGIAAGTGGAFSLLPPQNATGNWIKVVQRVPVRIALDPADLRANPLRIGLSTAVSVDTHDRSGSVLTALPATPRLTTSVFDQQLRQAEAEADRIIAQAAGDH